MNHELEETPVSLSNQPFTVLTHPKAVYGTELLIALRAEYPRRKFELVLVRSTRLEIQTVDAYTRVVVGGPRSSQVLMSNKSWTSLTKARAVRAVGYALDAEALFRKTQSHQRQQMKKYAERLAKTEMLDRVDLLFTMPIPTDEPKAIPYISIAFAQMPDVMIAEIGFPQYRPEPQFGNVSRFRVRFGNSQFRFEHFAQVESFFNGCDVFKATDTMVLPSHFGFVPLKTPKKDGEQSAKILVEYKRFKECVPYLILMLATDFELVTAQVTPHVWHPNASECEAMSAILHRSDDVRFVVCRGFQELQWKFDYAKKSPQLDVGYTFD